ncbi:MAG: Gfo/Idh/MocA family oxidoreductase [Bacteroidales bacterium]|nr:Gfo/Idh/MocA family oxidoreductase [Bacteroidales bacterium]
MSTFENKDNKNKTNIENSEQNISKGRREALKTLGTVPVLGAMAYGVYKKTKSERANRLATDIFHFQELPSPVLVTEGDVIRIGIIGAGRRGISLMRAIGFATPQNIDKLKKDAELNSQDTRYKDFLEQEDLNVKITAVCDIFDTYAERAISAGANIHREGLNGKYGEKPKRYLNYKELLVAPDVDAVIIATPDHWHAQMTMDAIKAGKHVYLEKPMSWTVPETYALRDIVRNSKVVFQLGHQNRQIETNKRGKEIIEKGLLGPITLIETSTNRNDPNGAWVYPIHADANPNTIDWKQFEGDPDRVKEYMDYMTSNGLAKYVGPEARDKFSLERFFRWRCWWDYSTGLSGDLLTHEYDAINQMMNVGIPDSATSSGGVYFFKDGRTVPDVLQTTFEYKEKDLAFLYSATQASQFKRSRKFMGHDATMEIGNSITITVDARSEKYKEQIDKGIIEPGKPFYNYTPGQKEVDAVTSATQLYFAERGLLYSYVNGKRYNTTFLHLKEWIDCIRSGEQPSCGIEEGFQEAITAHMGTRAYLEGRTMYWDAEKEEITKG